MTTITFDTLKFANKLKSAGIPDKHAEAIAEAQGDIFDKNFDDIITKREMEELKSQLATKADFARLETSTKADIAEVKRDIKELELRIAAEIAPLRWGMTATFAGIIALIIKTFFPH